MAETQMCLACNTNPAVTKGPVPLCSSCKALADENKRGVQFEKPEPPKSEPN